MNTPLLSIVVASHREGIVAHKTMLSIFRAAKKLDEAKVSYEIIITIDNGDAITHEYFSRYKNQPSIAVHELEFGDLALSRNKGISLARSKYVAILDADDLISENWLIDGVSYLNKSRKNVVLHTHYSVNFGTQDIVWEKFDSKSKEEDALIMTWANRWDSAIITPRSVLEKFPYLPNTDGYGSEDWHFNSQTLAANIPHKVVPETVLFVRRKDVSLMTMQAAGSRTLRYTNLLDFSFLRTINTPSYAQQSTQAHNRLSLKSRVRKSISPVVHGLRSIHSTAKNYSLYNKATKGLINSLKQIDTSSEQRFPVWLLEEWRAIHSIDKQIFPDNQLLLTVPLYHSEMYELGVHLCELAASLGKKPNYLIFVSHLTRGGAELVTLRYIRAIQRAHPDWHIAVVATEQGDNPWREQLPSSVDFVDFGGLTHHLPEQLRLQLLARFIVQSQASHLHIAQSLLMFRFTEQHKTLLRQFKMYAFAFCEDTDNQGRIAGHVHSGLPQAYDNLEKVFTDNNSIIQLLLDEYGYTKNKFITHYQPVETSILPPRSRINPEGPLRILWASRVAKQKRPDVLLEIARNLPKGLAQIDVYGSFQDGYDENIFANVKSIRYKALFSGIDTLPTAEYDAFLYTSENDGIPNLLLEAVAKGLPVIAPDIGGISELVSEESGLLIKNNEDTQGYIRAIELLARNDTLRAKCATDLQRILVARHSLDKFDRAVEQDIT